jgi:sec-independent protein translocase protein TatA
MAGLGAPEIIIIAIVIFALFGYRKLPDAARSVGRSMRIFKAETKGMREDGVQTKAEAEVVRGPLESGDKTPPTTATPTETPASTPITPTTESR